MAIYFVDDGGDNSDGSTWENAYTSYNSLKGDHSPLAAGDIVYFGADSQCQATNSASLTITGSTGGIPCYFISATAATGTVAAYEVATGNQIDTTEGAYDIKFDGCFSCHGIRVESGQDVIFEPDTDERQRFLNCEFAVAQGEYLYVGYGQQTPVEFINCNLDLTADATSTQSSPVLDQVAATNLTIRGMTFTNAGYRDSTLFSMSGNPGSLWEISGCDFSGFTQGSTVLSAGSTNGKHYMTNCNVPTGITLLSVSTLFPSFEAMFSNVSDADEPEQLYYRNYSGTIIGSGDVYRTSGAQIGGNSGSWLVNATTSSVSEGSPFYSPWIYGTLAAAGSTTFDVYIVNDDADLTDAQVWLEVEYKTTASEGVWALASDQRTITTTAAAQDDDTTSTWNGAGPAYTYKQKLSVTATVGATGQYRARVCIGAASLSSSSNFYIDPLVTAS